MRTGDPSCPLSCCSLSALELRPPGVVSESRGGEGRRPDKLRSGTPSVVLGGEEDESGKRARTASTIARMSSFVKGGWTLRFFGGGMVVGAPLTLLPSERVCLRYAWLLAGPAVCLFFLRGGITYTKITKFFTGWQQTQPYRTRSHYLTPQYTCFLRAQIFLSMPIKLM